MISERCSCGATFEIDWDWETDLPIVEAWRENHKHTEGCGPTFPTDERTVTLDVHDDPCDCDVCKTAWVKELKRRITNPGQSAEHPLDSPQNAPLSGNPDTPPSAENPYNPCDCWRCDDSCQNSTENGTVVTANADNLDDEGERRQETQVSIEDEPVQIADHSGDDLRDEPPAGTPVWFQGEWWARFPEADQYFPHVGNMTGRWWHEMPGAVAAKTPGIVELMKANAYVEGKAHMRKYLLADDEHSYAQGYNTGREAAAKAVEALTMVVAVNGTLMVRRGEAANAARGDKP